LLRTAQRIYGGQLGGYSVAFEVVSAYDEDPKTEETAEDYFPIFPLVCGRHVRAWKTHFRRGSFDVSRRGRGIQSIMISEEMLKHALVMR
jgi:hypothetical protein